MGALVDVKIAFRNLVQHRRRTLFLGGALAAVTALLVLLMGLGTGIRNTMIRSATTLMTGHINVGGFYKVTAGQAHAIVTDYEAIADIVRAEVPEMDYVVDRGRGWAKAVSEGGSMQVGVGGVDVTKEPAFKQSLQVIKGRIEDLAEPGTLLLFEDQAKKLEVTVGDMVTITSNTLRGANNTIDVRVVAIASNLGLLSMWNVFMPLDSLRALYQVNEQATGVVQLMLKESEVPKAAAIAERLRGILKEKGYRVLDPSPQAFWMKFETVNREDWTGQKLDVTIWEDEVSFMSWTLQALNALTVLLIGILLGIVVIGIMNTMWIAIRERTREIGTLRAIGMQRFRVLWMFLVEAMMLGAVGTLVGAVLGLTLAALINAAHIGVPLSVQMFLMSDHVVLAVKGSSLLSAIISITVVTGLAALYPALRAARLKPVVAMQHFG